MQDRRGIADRDRIPAVRSATSGSEPLKIVWRREHPVRMGARLGAIAQRRDDFIGAIEQYFAWLVERHAAHNRRLRERPANISKAATNVPTAASPQPTPIASFSPAATSKSGDGVSPAASAAASASLPGRAAATANADGGRRSGSQSRQRRITRSTAGSRSRTRDEGVVIVAVSCNCLRSLSVFASYVFVGTSRHDGILSRPQKRFHRAMSLLCDGVVHSM